MKDDIAVILVLEEAGKSGNLRIGNLHLNEKCTIVNSKENVAGSGDFIVLRLAQSLA